MKHAFITLMLGLAPLLAQEPTPAAQEEPTPVAQEESPPVAQEEPVPVEEPSSPHVNELLLVVGAEGEEEYGQTFIDNLVTWQSAASKGQVKVSVIDAASKGALASVESYLKESPKELAVPLWVVLIGHGTYNRRQAYFNLAGPDLSAEDLKKWLEPFKRPLIIVNTASSSGAFLPILSEPNRITMTATKSGNEVNFASFGSYLAGALMNPEADLNNDGENSVFELFQYAARQTADYYEQEGRIQTETPLLDDNGDRRGTSLKDLDAIREGGKSKREPDGSFAKRWALVLSPEEQAIPPEVRQKRNVLETQIDELRRRRAELEEEEYYSELEALAVQISDLYAELEPAESEEEDAEEQTSEAPSIDAEVAVPTATDEAEDTDSPEESTPASNEEEEKPVEGESDGEDS